MPFRGVKLRFPNAESMMSALARDGSPRSGIVNVRRGYITLADGPATAFTEPPVAPPGDPIDIDIELAEPTLELWREGLRRRMDRFGDSAQHVRMCIEDFGAVLVPDFEYDLDGFGFDGNALSAEDMSVGVNDIRAACGLAARPPDAGHGATIAIVDTGVDPIAAGIEGDRQLLGWSWSEAASPWADTHGHGTRSARIACGIDGLAPGARAISCRTRFRDSELAALYDFLRESVLPQCTGPLIVNNSFGIMTGSPPVPDPYGDFPAALADAIAAGAVVVFSAGNNHESANGAPDACAPTTIWDYKCRRDVLTIGAVDSADRPQPTSSRGPGQFVALPTSGLKPDLAAFVPDRRWGTSAAAPQVAAAAALAVTANPDADSSAIAGHVRTLVRSVNEPPSCVGAGVLDASSLTTFTAQQ